MGAMSTFEKVVIGLVSISITVVIAITIIVELQGTQTADTLGYNLTGDLLDNFTLIVSLVAVVIIAALGMAILKLVKAGTGGEIAG